MYTFNLNFDHLNIQVPQLAHVEHYVISHPFQSCYATHYIYKPWRKPIYILDKILPELQSTEIIQHLKEDSMERQCERLKRIAWILFGWYALKKTEDGCYLTLNNTRMFVTYDFVKKYL